jgi:DNA-binding GntR family transcriptional regulator
VPSSARSASLLGLAERDPLLQLDEITFDQYDEPFETARLLNRGDRYAFTTALGAGRSSARVEL